MLIYLKVFINNYWNQLFNSGEWSKVSKATTTRAPQSYLPWWEDWRQFKAEAQCLEFIMNSISCDWNCFKFSYSSHITIQFHNRYFYYLIKVSVSKFLIYNSVVTVQNKNCYRNPTNSFPYICFLEKRLLTLIDQSQ